MRLMLQHPHHHPRQKSQQQLAFWPFSFLQRHSMQQSGMAHMSGKTQQQPNKKHAPPQQLQQASPDPSDLSAFVSIHTSAALQGKHQQPSQQCPQLSSPQHTFFWSPAFTSGPSQQLQRSYWYVSPPHLSSRRQSVQHPVQVFCAPTDSLPVLLDEPEPEPDPSPEAAALPEAAASSAADIYLTAVGSR